MSKQDEAFWEWWDENCDILGLDANESVAGHYAWDASHEHDAAELARKDELLAAYREFVRVSDMLMTELNRNTEDYWTMNDTVHLAMRHAVCHFGSENVFNSAGFGLALRRIAGLRSEGLDGRLVEVILHGRDDVEQLSGGAHWRLKADPAPTNG